MITIITRWETTQMEPATEWKQWRQILGSFAESHQDIQVWATPMVASMEGYERLTQFPSLEAALSSLDEGTERCFLEPTGYKSLYDLPKGDFALILGNTEKHNMEHAQVNETYAIKTPNGVNRGHLYGTNAAAIALAYWYGQ
jgi:hypothetical protein